MRVITGSARGRRLKEPAGQDIRPTTDRVKEGIFNIIQFRLEGSQVLDLFAGTGQMGIEALSRGAREATFVEMKPEAQRLVRENLARCALEDRGRIVPKDALAFLSTTREKYDVIFLDPPYDKGLLEEALNLIGKFDILREHGIILCESDTSAQLPERFQNGTPCRSYRYGKTKITVYEL